MPKPTQAALQKHPAAVVMLSSLKDTPDVVGDYDFEWFETPEGRAEFWSNLVIWATEDVRDHGDIIYVMVNLSDTKNFTVEDVQVFAAKDTVDAAWIKARGTAIKADGTLVVAPPATRAPKGSAAKKTVKKVVKGRKPSTAAAAVKGKVEAGNEPKPKAVRRPANKKAETVAAAPKPKNARAAALKQRLAAKKGDDEARLADIDAALDGAPAMGFRVDLFR